MSVAEKQLSELLSKLTDDRLSSDEEAMLFSLLQDERARSTYLDHVELHAMLRWVEAEPLDAVCADGLAGEVPPVEVAPVTLDNADRGRERGRMFDWLGDALPAGVDYRAHPGRFGVMVAGITLACWAMLIVFITPGTQPVTVAAPQKVVSPVVAQLTGALNAEWGEQQPAVVGQRLQAGERFAIEAGYAEITFGDGARVIVEGPALLQFETAGRGQLLAGSLTALVPPRAVGFSITTPAARLVDLGTEFAVQVDRNGTTEVQVFQGRIRAELVDAEVEHGSNERILVANQAARFTRQTSRVTAIPFDAQRRRVLRAGKKFIAYRHKLGLAGVQTGTELLGHDFIVHRPISVTRLGAFDSNADGYPRMITVELWSRQDGDSPHEPHDDRPGEKLVTVVFNTDAPGELVGSARFKPVLRPIVLMPGAYTIVAYGYGEGEPNGNSKFSEREPDFKSTEDGQGALEFVGTARYGTRARQPHTTFPMTIGDGPADRYRAGTFEYRVPGVYLEAGQAEAGTPE